MEPSQDDLFRDRIGALGMQLVSWWRTVGDRFPDRDMLLADLLRAGVVDGERIGNRGWQLQKALALVPDLELDWKFKFPAEAVRYSTFPNNVNVGCHSLVTETANAGAGPEASCGYRSVRRQIYKKYVSGHKQCYRVLKNLTLDEQHMLDGDHVCPVAMAYVIWRMGAENFVRVAGLSTSRRKTPNLRLIGLTRQGDLTDDVKVRCAYFSFFGILRNLKLLLGSRNIRIQRYDDYANCLFQFGAEVSGPGSAKVSRLAVLYPDISPDDAVDVRRCVRRTHQTQRLVDASWGNLARPVRFPNEDDHRTSDMLFQIRHMDFETTRSGFTYISV